MIEQTFSEVTLDAMWKLNDSSACVKVARVDETTAIIQSRADGYLEEGGAIDVMEECDFINI